MKKQYSVLLAAALVGVSWFAVQGVASGPAPLPYLDTFESGSWSASDPWSAGGGVGTLVEGTADEWRQGGRSVIVSNDNLTLTVTPATYSNVWVQVYAKPVSGNEDPSISSVSSSSGAFYLSNGTLRAYGKFGGSDTWSTITNGLPAAGWIGFVLHIDYNSGKWDIYQTTGLYGTPMTKLNNYPISFPASGASAKMVSLTVQSGDKAYVDAVAVSRAGASVSETSPSMVDVYEFAAAEATNALALPVYSDVYTNAGANTLAGALGQDLCSGLQDNDILKIYYTNGLNGFHIYSNEWARGAGGIYEKLFPIEMPVTPSTVLKLARSGTSVATLGFFAYNAALAPLVGGVTNGPIIYSFELNGTNSADTSGFTSIGWAKNDTPLADLPWSSTNHLAKGDRLYKADPALPNTYKLYIWNDSPARWERFGTAATNTVPAGASMWVRRYTGPNSPAVNVSWN